MTKISLTAVRFLPCFALAFLQFHQSAYGQGSWPLPKTLDDSNTKVSFEVDSTWHLVKGSTSGITGELRQSDPNSPLAVAGTVTVPVKSFNTENSLRDKRLGEVMDLEHHVDVSLTISGISESCLPSQLPCNGTLNGSLQIRGKSLPVQLPFHAERDAAGVLHLSGSYELRWADYGVEDPSIIVAKLAPVATIRYEVTL